LCLFSNADDKRIIAKTARLAYPIFKDMTMKKSTFPRSAQEREKLLDELRQNPVTSHYARTAMDIYHPNARILELRRQGFNIDTHWETIYNGKAKHRVGKWVLLSGGNNG
jgi:Helix-turn-helix domain